MSEFPMSSSAELVRIAFRVALTDQNLPIHLILSLARLSEVPVRRWSHRKDSFPREDSCPSLPTSHDDRRVVSHASPATL